MTTKIRITVLLDPDMRDALEARSSATGIPASTYMRSLLLRDAEFCSELEKIRNPDLVAVGTPER